MPGGKRLAGKGRSRARTCPANREHEKCSVMFWISKCASIWHFKHPEMASNATTQEWLLQLCVGSGLLNSCNCANAMANMFALW